MSKKEFELARIMMVNAAREGHVEHHRGFAWASRICPNNPTPLEQAFGDDFDVDQAKVEAVLKVIDVGFLNRKPVTFYSLEAPIGQSKLGVSRYHLIAICRMAFLNGLFDEDTWRGLQSDSPSELGGFRRKFDPQDDLAL